MVSNGPGARMDQGAKDHRAAIGAMFLLVGSLLATVVAYLVAAGETLRPLGPDSFGYIWQTRLVGQGPLSAIGTRPGLPVLSAVLAGLGLTPRTDAPLITSLVLIVALGFAVAVVLRVAFSFPRWAVCSIGVTVALWGGAVHLSQGHLANELSLACIVPAVFILVTGEVTRGAILGGVAAATASGFAHPGVLAFYLVVAGVWVVISSPSLGGTAHPRRRWWYEPTGSFALVLVSAAAIVTAVLGAMGFRFDDLTNLTDGVQVFSHRLDLIASSIGLWVSAVTVFAVAGGGYVWARRGTISRPLMLLGAAWILVSAAGGLLGSLQPSLPGHRVLGMIVPLPALAGLGAVGAALGIRDEVWFDVLPRTYRPPAGVGTWLALGVVIASCVLVALAGLVPLTRRAALPIKADAARAIATYIAEVTPEEPVVIFTEPTTPAAALSWRGRQNQVRALSPRASIERIFVVVGILDSVGLPVRRPPAADVDDEAIESAITNSWAQGGGAALRDGAVVVAARDYVGEPIWQRLSDDRSRIVMPGLAVIRGPLVSPAALVPEASVSIVSAGVRAILCVLALGALGGGYAIAVVNDRAGGLIDIAALAPAIGAVVVVITGTAVGLAGIDPSGTDGLLVLGASVAAGYVLAARSASASSTRSTSSSEL